MPGLSGRRAAACLRGPPEVVAFGDILAAAERIRGSVAYTPLAKSETLSALVGANVFLKFENLQFTASFKERGALNRLLTLTPAERAGGVIAMSAGNHAQALAHHGRRLGVPTVIVMPRHTPNAKVEQTRVFGAEILLHGASFDETLGFTKELAAQRNLTLIHPFDDPAVVAGQGTVGLEVVADQPDLDAFIVPVGGGGLIAGTSLAAKHAVPDIEIVGAQAERFAAVYEHFHGSAGQPAPAFGTVAEGIAVKSPSALTLGIIQRWVDDVITVSEEEIEAAVFMLLEVEKTVAEGAGAAALAALFKHRERFAGRNVAVVVSGGNIDMMTLSSLLQRGLVRRGRLVRLRVELPDVPGSLSAMTAILGELDSNIMEIVHQRAFGASSVSVTLVDLTLRMRGEEQAEVVLQALAKAGYAARILD